ncbi:hypothetical protein [Actinokineospora sp. NBRC 105648]|uniref:hypothetical protein n=1 Tax=Actinokineospora sp. NBRC 105648 TaxID=3032206 RepID=UPI00249FFB04|nr:hypothetical protein [Actinokineospora sp. NBRC 105648]GLZ38888.1 hypothetical protein Acsp05_25120 [Actinokineospora sp. NBRC 105648]
MTDKTTGRRGTAARAAGLGVVIAAFLVPLASAAHAAAQTTTAPSTADSDTTDVSFRIVRPAQPTPTPTPLPQPLPQPLPPAAASPVVPTIAATGLDLPVLAVVGSALGMIALGVLMVARAGRRARPTR